MKNKFMADILVYIVSPIIAYSIEPYEMINYTNFILIGIILFYTLIVNKKEARVNISAIAFSIIYISISIAKQSTQDEFLRYTYEVYFLMLVSISMLVLRYIGKSIIKQLYIDILKLNQYSINNMYNALKNKKLMSQFEKINLVVIIHLLCIVLLRIYTISVYKSDNYIATKDFEILINIIFIIGEIYMICVTIQIHKIQKINKYKSKKDNVITMSLVNKKQDNKVIYLSKYKKTNK